MTLDAGNTDKLAMYTSEAKKSGIAILPPCINASEVDFLAGEKAIRYSLAALKNIGAQAVESIVAERAANGAFKDLSDFAGRCNTKALNKRALETLAAAGAFDALEPNRALVHGNVEQMLAFSNRLATNAAQGIGDLFGGGAAARPQIDVRPLKAWTPMERLQHEFDAVGFFLSGHPLDAYASVLAKLGILSFTGAGGARGPRRRRGAARRHRRLGARAPLAEGQQVRLRNVLGADWPIRGRDLLRGAGRLAAICWSPARRCC